MMQRVLLAGNEFLQIHRGGGGNAKRKFIAKPQKIVIGDNDTLVRAFACGEKHTCILQQDGSLVTLGANDAGQLGIGTTGNNYYKQMQNQKHIHIIQTIKRGPHLINSIPFKEIAAGNNHCAAISSQDGALYTWGWGKNGRLGHGNESHCNQPTHVEALSAVGPLVAVACGVAHTLVATADGGDVYGFGWNAHGQVVGTCKDGEMSTLLDDCMLPVACLKSKGVVKLSCSGFHSAAVTVSGHLYVWGKYWVKQREWLF